MPYTHFARNCSCVCGMVVLLALCTNRAHAQRPDSARKPADSAQVLSAFTTTGSAVSARLLSVGFDERRRTSGTPPGQFITRQHIERANAGNLREMLNSLGTRARGCANGSIFIDGVLTTSGNGETDGAPRRTRSATTTSSMSRSEHLDRVSPRDVEGMEVYVGASQIPALFRVSGVSGRPPTCVIVLWMRNS